MNDMNFSYESGFVFGLILIFFGILILPIIFYLRTLYNCLLAISPQNRRLEPGNVWLLLIPVFNLVYGFMVVKGVSESIKLEAYSKSIYLEEANPGLSMGNSVYILRICNIIPCVGFFTVLPWLICWIIYWSKIADFKRRIETAVSFDFEKDQIRF